MEATQLPDLTQWFLMAITLALGLGGSLLQLKGARLDSKAAALFENYKIGAPYSIELILRARTAARKRSLAEDAASFNFSGTSTLFFALIAGLTIAFPKLWLAAIVCAILSSLSVLLIHLRKDDVTLRLSIFERSQEAQAVATHNFGAPLEATLDYCMTITKPDLLKAKEVLDNFETTNAAAIAQIRADVNQFEPASAARRTNEDRYMSHIQTWLKRNAKQIAWLAIAVLTTVTAIATATSALSPFGLRSTNSTGNISLALYESKAGLLVKPPTLHYVDARGLQAVTLDLPLNSTTTASSILLWSPSLQTCNSDADAHFINENPPIWKLLISSQHARTLRIWCSLRPSAKPIETSTYKLAEFNLATLTGGALSSFVRIPKIYVCLPNTLNGASHFPISPDDASASRTCKDQHDATLDTQNPMVKIRYNNELGHAQSAFVMAVPFGLLLTIAGAAWWSCITWVIEMLCDALGWSPKQVDER